MEESSLLYRGRGPLHHSNLRGKPPQIAGECSRGLYNAFKSFLKPQKWIAFISFKFTAEKGVNSTTAKYGPSIERGACELDFRA